MAQIICRELAVGNDERLFCSGIDFSVEQGDYIAVIGAEGTGKSELLETLLGVRPPLRGEVIREKGCVPSAIGFLPRLLIAFFNTDEIFALAMARTEPLTIPFMLGLGTLPIVGWTLGTLCGGLAGSVLPASIQAALGVMLYGMFIAIVVPPAKTDRKILAAVILALICSSAFTWVPVLKTVSAGISIVICTVAAAGICAALLPIEEEAEAAV